VRIVSWNVRHQGLETRLAEVVSCLVDSGAEIVALQEVATSLIDSTAGLLSNYGYVSSVDSFGQTASGRWGRKPFASMVLSKWQATPASTDWHRDSPFPESFARAVVTSPSGPLDVMSVHVPNGASNGWKKVATFHTLAEELAVAPDIPQIVAGDFNEPKELRADGSIVTFSEVDQGRNTEHRLWTDHDGETGDLYEWEEAVQAVLGDKPAHRLQDVHRLVHGCSSMPYTHPELGGGMRWFDHILVSPELRVTRCGLYSEWREAGVSDHAAVWADME